MSVNDNVMIDPAPSPWMPRDTMSIHMVALRPHNNEPIAKTAIDRRNRRVAPKLSASFPAKGITTADVNRYVLTTHARPLYPPRSPTIVGSAVDTDV